MSFPKLAVLSSSHCGISSVYETKALKGFNFFLQRVQLLAIDPYVYLQDNCLVIQYEAPAIGKKIHKYFIYQLQWLFYNNLNQISLPIKLRCAETVDLYHVQEGEFLLRRHARPVIPLRSFFFAHWMILLETLTRKPRTKRG